jgi:L-ascorbate metabolism protein UlaG (beta-lactamase superfamily)
MRLTKFTHSCVRLDDGDRTVVIDPGVFSEVEQALDGVDTLLITHDHADHLDVDRVRAAAQGNPRLRIWAPASVAETLGDLGERVVAVSPGDSFEAGGFEVRTFGGQHAVIHPTIPVIPNVGFLIEGVFHPGDALIVPPADIRTLLLPIHAPWSNIAQVIDFAVSVRAPAVYPIHNSLLNPPGTAVVEGLVTRMAGEFGSAFTHLDVHDTVETV